MNSMKIMGKKKKSFVRIIGWPLVLPTWLLCLHPMFLFSPLLLLVTESTVVSTYSYVDKNKPIFK